MITFQDMIKSGIAKSNTQSYLPELPSRDQFVRHYNMYWGVVTDTHMSEFGDCYIITGGRVARKEIFRALLTADHWEDLVFPQTFAYLMMRNDLCGLQTMINGQEAFIICKWDGQDPNPVFIDNVKGAYVPQIAKRFSCDCIHNDIF